MIVAGVFARAGEIKVPEVKTDVVDPVGEAAFKSWLAHVKGSWSKSDAEIYVAGFKAGWVERGRTTEVAGSENRSTEAAVNRP